MLQQPGRSSETDNSPKLNSSHSDILKDQLKPREDTVSDNILHIQVAFYFLSFFKKKATVKACLKGRKKNQIENSKN